MANLTKRDMVVKISEEVGITQQQAFAVIQKTLEHITDSLAEGNNVELRNFGVFQIKQREARLARNPRTGEPVPVEAKNVVTFKPGKEMEERVRQFKASEGKTPETPHDGADSPPPSQP